DSKQLVKSIDKELKIIYFATTSKLDSREGVIIQAILKQYEKNSKNIKLEIIDVNKRPDLAKNYEIYEDGTVYLSYNNRNKKLSSIDFWEITQAPDETSQGKQLFTAEKLISSAIRYLLSAEGKKVYFILGHKEKYTNDYQPEGYSTVSEYLGKINREVININLLEKGKIPEDASLIVIAAPTEDYSKEEIKLIEEYISKGGKFILITDFDVNSNIVSILLKKYDIIQQNGVLVDNINYFYGLGFFYPLLQLSYHKITEKVQEYNKPVLIKTAAPLIINPDTPRSEDYQIISLGNTFETSWNDIAKEYDFKSEPDFDKNKEKKGVKHLGFVIESLKAKNSKGQNEPIGIIYCDSDMFTNNILKYGYSLGNLMLFENSVNFLLDDFVLLNIPGKDLDTTKVTLSAKAHRYISLTLFVFIEVLALLIIFGLRFYKNYIKKFELRKEVENEKIE
ncbi:MAG: Gldg family protein, partial [Exilispira sp.]